eukprot:CAMPEP_0116827182 /NCGR_PEP_ID=MMETSP0418-20121206/2952_1 /TAXON_ID=1158023 /ORGANISM="Astrosyne radiata, Strain 13vi08-1A" /LENGTH=98 /DNA_ID=CAMNT_0004455919 /DNA_START=260 /DNA_END=553 /DNA_ORIENTATION=+
MVRRVSQLPSLGISKSSSFSAPADSSSFSAPTIVVVVAVVLDPSSADTATTPPSLLAVLIVVDRFVSVFPLALLLLTSSDVMGIPEIPSLGSKAPETR